LLPFRVAPSALLEVGNARIETVETLLEVGRYLVVFLAARALAELMAVGQQATTVAITGVLLPFSLGTAGLDYLFHVPLFPAVFAGASMTATSIGITASVFGELKFLRTREGQTVIGAAVLDDIFDIVILAVAVALLLSRTAAPAFDWVLDRLMAPGEVVVAGFVVLGLCCFTAEAIGLEAALGAFAAGLILSASRHTAAIQESVKPLVALFLLAVAVGGTVAAGWSYLSVQKTNRLVVGLGMMPRGEVGLIFLGLGSQAGILSAPPLEAAILLMVIGTTFLAPLLLRLALSGVAASADGATEQAA
jgi:Kef-type K+ transport system membrane component KefB